ncbi:hypothetical protein BT96DRAFT_1018874 [Gymnopus androsaceus JB14]|uniref:Uncharacterized protein n=1 Tax=Gymnopus androsaceus JB14 TaxID=1447944 RepID=A0A6A4HND2_9AGAR|nr:hypothetical protein BT96DRAFT_1018874 [Gymnopus androsaceus JB14]
MVYVRADIAQLLANKTLAFIPTTAVANTLLEVTKFNFFATRKGHGPLESRKSAFEVLHSEKYEYRLVPLREEAGPIIYDDCKSHDDVISTLIRLNHRRYFRDPSTDLPCFELKLHPLYAILRAYFGLTFLKSFPHNAEVSKAIQIIGGLFRSSLPEAFRENTADLQDYDSSSSESSEDDDCNDHLFSKIPCSDQTEAEKISLWREGAESILPEDAFEFHFHKHELDIMMDKYDARNFRALPICDEKDYGDGDLSRSY